MTPDRATIEATLHPTFTCKLRFSEYADRVTTVLTTPLSTGRRRRTPAR
jgi:hypothetical protein